MNENNVGGISMGEPIFKPTDTTEQPPLAEPVFQAPEADQPNQATASSEMVQTTPGDEEFYCIGAYRFKFIKTKLSPQDEQNAATILDYVDCGRTAEAIKMAQDLSDRNISSEIAWYCNALAKGAAEDYPGAYYAYQQAIAINNKFANAYEDYGYALATNKEFAKAQECFETAHEIDPENVYYMSDLARILVETQGTEASIEKFRYFIERASEKTVLENSLGEVLVESCVDLVVDIPNDPENPNGETTPGFLTLEDIETARKRCNEALSLLTLASSESSAEFARTILEQCDIDSSLERYHKKSFVIFHTVMSAIFTFFATCCTMGIYLPFGIIMTYATYKADFFPAYWINYALYTGSDDPFQYKKDKFRNKHEILQAAIDGGKDGWNSTGSSSSSVGGALFSGLVVPYIKRRFWFMKARIEFYKRFIKNMKDKKKNSIDKI